ncbi:MAG: hypothetical protein ACRENP_21620 [Longimicrobiales bacterium]
MNDEKLRAAYALLMETRAGRADCVTPEALFAVAGDTASEADRLSTLRHVAVCRACQADLELLRTTHQVALRVSRPVWRSPAFAVAASVLVLLGSVALWRSLRPADELMRGGSSAVQLRAPADNAAPELPVQLTWTAAESTRGYTVEIVRTDGAAVFQAATADTTLIVPATAALVPGVDYRWWVNAQLNNGTQRRSAVRRLRITTP